MQLTIPTIAAATFLATLAFAPAIASVAERFTQPSATVKIEMPTKQALTCAPAVKIVTALRGKNCK
jgi:acetaldehyde dehydrogenase (acetylating)